MNLRNKKKLIARTFGVGIDRIKITSGEEIKEAITKQDIKDLVNQGLIIIKDKKGVRGRNKKKTRKGAGSRKFTVKKDNYLIITRKLRGYIKNLKKKGKISKEEHYKFGKKIKSRIFKDLSHLKQEIRMIK
jgi:large subunit ribosomal protein L19e